jgi:hypothetical protein
MLQLLSLLEPLRAQQAQIDATRPDPLLGDSQLLAAALSSRSVTAKRITEGRWVFEFRGHVIGGFANRVTTLVSAHSRRLLGDPAQLRAHLDLMEVPHAIGSDDAFEQFQPMLPIELEESDSDQDQPALLQAYCVGKSAVSVIGVLPDPEGSGKTLTIDVTDRVDEDISQLAVNGLCSVPGLLAGAVNLQVSSLDTVEGGVVMGIDETASTVPHHYPDLGPGRAVADAVAEHILFTAAL